MKRVTKELGGKHEAVLWFAREYAAILWAFRRGETDLPTYNKAVMALLEAASAL